MASKLHAGANVVNVLGEGLYIYGVTLPWVNKIKIADNSFLIFA